MHHRRSALSVLAGAALALGTRPAAAREETDPARLAILGFSPDGRSFAYEQYLDDVASDTACAAIDVVDRDTGRSAAGFPLGHLPVKDARGRYPARIGEHAIVIDDALSGAKRLAKLRRALQAAAAKPLGAFAIGRRGREIRPIEGAEDDPFTFVLGTGGSRRRLCLATKVDPQAAIECEGGEAASEHIIGVDLAAVRSGTEPAPVRQSSVTRRVAPGECARLATIVRVVGSEPPPQRGGRAPVSLGVIVLRRAWALHSDTLCQVAAVLPAASGLTGGT